MFTQPTLLEAESNEFSQLRIACQVLSELTYDMLFKIEDIYFDAGQDWKWTTIVAYNLKENNQWQCLSPREWEEIINGATRNQIKETCKNMIKEYPRLYNEVINDNK